MYILFFFLSLLFPLNAEVVHFNFALRRYETKQIVKAGIYKGGSISLAVSLKTEEEKLPLIQIFNIDQWDFQSSFTNVENIENYCYLPTLYRFQVDRELYYLINVNMSDLYIITATNCHSHIVNVGGSVTIMSPDITGELSHYSGQYKYDIYVYIMNCVIMFGLILFSLEIIYRYRTNPLVYPAIIWVTVMIINLLSIFFHIIYFYDYSHKGDKFSFWFYCYHVFDILFRGYSYFVIGLFAYGWRTYSDKSVRKILFKKPGIFFTLIECLYSVFQIIRIGISNELTDDTQTILYHVEFALYLFVAVKLLSIFCYGPPSLSIEAYHERWCTEIAVLYKYIAFVDMLRVSFMIYIVMPIIFQIITMLTFGWNDSWITKMFLAIIEIHFFSSVFIAFQPFFSIQLNYLNKYINDHPTDDTDLSSTIVLPNPDKIPSVKTTHMMKLKTN